MPSCQSFLDVGVMNSASTASQTKILKTQEKHYTSSSTPKHNKNIQIQILNSTHLNKYQTPFAFVWHTKHTHTKKTLHYIDPKTKQQLLLRSSSFFPLPGCREAVALVPLLRRLGDEEWTHRVDGEVGGWQHHLGGLAGGFVLFVFVVMVFVFFGSL